jgi:hypothetical protein
MTDHPTDDFDELLRSAARDYNRPGETPREQMWSEIRAERARRASIVAAPARARPMWLIPAAAAAVLILGIAIGRTYDSWKPQPTTPGMTASAKTDSAITPSNTQLAVVPATPDSQRNPATNTPRSVGIALRSTHDAQRAAAPRSEPFNHNAARMAYRLAVVEHLAGTEAMLTSFRAAAKRGEVDAQMTAWARNLLTTTRLLEASAAQDDPTMKRLLDDLELVLVQIAQYTSAGTHHAEELELIEHSIERRGVIGKLQMNLPARVTRAGT